MPVMDPGIRKPMRPYAAVRSATLALLLLAMPVQLRAAPPAPRAAQPDVLGAYNAALSRFK